MYLRNSTTKESAPLKIVGAIAWYFILMVVHCVFLLPRRLNSLPSVVLGREPQRTFGAPIPAFIPDVEAA